MTDNEAVQLYRRLKAFLPYVEKALIELKKAHKSNDVKKLELLNAEFREQARKCGFLPTFEEELKYENITKKEFKEFIKEVRGND